VVTLGKRDAVDLPLKRSLDLVERLFVPLGFDIGNSGFERVTELTEDLIREGLRPAIVDPLIEVETDAIRNVAEDPQRSGIHGAKFEVGVHEIDAEWSLVEQGLKLRSTLAQSHFRLFANARHFKVSCTRAISSRALKGLMR